MAVGESFGGVLQAARFGADWAWEVLYRDLAPVVTGYARMNGAAEPDDVTADVFLCCVRDLHRFEGDEAHFRSWVFTIAHRRVIDGRRTQGRRPATPTAPDELERSGPSADAETEAMELLSFGDVRRVIERLTPDQKDVLLLRIIGGLSLQEVANTLERSLTAVKALQRRGLAQIALAISRQEVSI